MIAEAGLNTIIEECEIIDLLDSLIAKSLVFYDETDGMPRYRLLESIRQYSVERLYDSPEGVKVRDRHLEWFLGLAEEAEPHVRSAARAEVMRRLHPETDNFRLALEWCGKQPHLAETRLRLAGLLWWFWYFTGHAGEARRWLEESLEWNGDTASLDRAWGQYCLAAAHRVTGNMEDAVRLGEASIAAFREVDDPVGLAYALVDTAWAEVCAGDTLEARSRSEEGLSLIREHGSDWDAAFLIGIHGYVMMGIGSLHLARRAFKESATRWRQSAMVDRWGLAMSLVGLGLISARLGDYSSARAVIEEAMEMRRAEGDRRNIAECLNLLGEIARRQMEFRHAGALFIEALRLYVDFGDRSGAILAVINLAHLAHCQLDHDRAARLFATVHSPRQQLGTQVTLMTSDNIDSYIDDVCSAMGRQAFAIAWDEGVAMSIEAAVHLALSESNHSH